jgi:hypothetical protein
MINLLLCSNFEQFNNVLDILDFVILVTDRSRYDWDVWIMWAGLVYLV